MNKSLPTTELRSHQLKYKILMLVLLCAGYAHAQVMSSSDPALEGQPVTFTVEIDAPSGVTVTPTGTVTFTDNDQNIGTAPLQNGTAVFTTQFSGTGDHIIVAEYSGDANFTPSSSPPFTEHITADDVFTLAVSPSLITQQAGDSSTLNVTVFGSGNNGPVRFSCEDLPPGAACSFQPGSVVPNPQGIAATATVSSAGKAHRAGLWRASPVFYAGFLAPLVFLRRRRWLLSLGVSALLCVLFANAGCGGKVRVLEGGTPAGSYTIHVTATDGTNTQQAAVKLTIH
jgi:hypothetical protein